MRSLKGLIKLADAIGATTTNGVDQVNTNWNPGVIGNFFKQVKNWFFPPQTGVLEKHIYPTYTDYVIVDPRHPERGKFTHTTGEGYRRVRSRHAPGHNDSVHESRLPYATKEQKQRSKFIYPAIYTANEMANRKNYGMNTYWDPTGSNIVAHVLSGSEKIPRAIGKHEVGHALFKEKFPTRDEVDSTDLYDEEHSAHELGGSIGNEYAMSGLSSYIKHDIDRFAQSEQRNHYRLPGLPDLPEADTNEPSSFLTQEDINTLTNSLARYARIYNTTPENLLYSDITNRVALIEDGIPEDDDVDIHDLRAFGGDRTRVPITTFNVDPLANSPLLNAFDEVHSLDDYNKMKRNGLTMPSTDAIFNYITKVSPDALNFYNAWVKSLDPKDLEGDSYSYPTEEAYLLYKYPGTSEDDIKVFDHRPQQPMPHSLEDEDALEMVE